MSNGSGLPLPFESVVTCRPPQNLRLSIQDAENGDCLAVALEPEGKRLGRAEFQGLSDTPPELEWFANLVVFAYPREKVHLSDVRHRPSLLKSL